MWDWAQILENWKVEFAQIFYKSLSIGDKTPTGCTDNIKPYIYRVIFYNTYL